MADNETITRRDVIEEGLTKIEERDTAPAGETAAPVTETVAETVTLKDERPREPDGKFAPKTEAKPTKADTASPAKLRGEQKGAAAAPSTAATTNVAPTTIEKLKPPSTWRKEHWARWEKLDPETQKYVLEREGQFAQGVSTYKGEYDRVKPIADALSKYQPFMQQAGIRPEQFVAGLAETDQTLRYGTEEQKLRAFAKFAQDYRVPLHQLLVQGEDGKVYMNQQYFQPQPQAQAPASLTPQDVQGLVAKELRTQMMLRAFHEFVAAKDKDGNPSHPHFAEVRQTMDGLLRSGLAKDLPDAYRRALKQPEHEHLLEAEQKQRRDAEEAERAKKAAENAARAKAKVTSVRSQAPTALVTDAKDKKSRNEQLSENFDMMLGSRVG